MAIKNTGQGWKDGRGAPVDLDLAELERRVARDRARPVERPSRRRIIVTGLPRSGTSWLAKALACSPGFTLYREPDNFDFVEGAHEWFRYLYLTADRDDPAYRELLTAALDGRVVTPFTMSDDPGAVLGRLPRRLAVRLGRQFPALYMRKRDVVVKLVNSNLALEWLAASFPDIRHVHVVRHPCGVFASWQRLGWEPEPKRLLDDARLVDEHLAGVTGVIEKADSFWERAGALWAAYYTVIGKQLADHPDWVALRHEWLCGDRIGGFQALFARLDIEWSHGAEHFLEVSDRAGATGEQRTQRLAADEIDKWKRNVDAADVDTCRRTIDAFGLDLYPGFEPDTSAPDWIKTGVGG